jgi:hypothetical protein
MTKDSKNNTAKGFNGILRKECKEGGVLILPNDQEFNLTLENLNSDIFLELRRLLHTLLDHNIVTKEPGYLKFNDWSKRLLYWELSHFANKENSTTKALEDFINETTTSNEGCNPYTFPKAAIDDNVKSEILEKVCQDISKKQNSELQNHLVSDLSNLVSQYLQNPIAVPLESKDPEKSRG